MGRIKCSSTMCSNLKNYETCFIYRIISPSLNKIYIGSTTKTIKDRLIQHEADFRRWKNGAYDYVTSFELIESGDYYIQILDILSCESSKDLVEIEYKWINKYPNCVNKNKTHKNQKEYDAMYYLKNKELITARKNKRVICESCGVNYRHGGRSCHMRSQKHLQSLSPDNKNVTKSSEYFP